MSVVVSKSINKFVPSSRWIASLSNGETIFEDHRDGEDVAWERLARYVEEEELSITNLRVQFESGRTITLPAGQEGYIQKKKAWLTSGAGGVMLCIGYASKGKCLVHEASNSGDSISIIGKDPGPPWTIYKKEIRDAAKLFTELELKVLANAIPFGNKGGPLGTIPKKKKRKKDRFRLVNDDEAGSNVTGEHHNKKTKKKKQLPKKTSY